MYFNDYSELGLLPEPPVPDPHVPRVSKPVAYVARWVASALLWPVASAHREGNRLAAGFSFANGYARMLRDLTSTLPAIVPDDKRLSKLNWQNVFQRETKRYIELGYPDARDATSNLYEAGRALVFQSFLDFIGTHGTDAWKQIQREHRRIYGEDDLRRQQRYEAILHKQVREKEDIGIPLQLSGGRPARGD